MKRVPVRRTTTAMVAIVGIATAACGGSPPPEPAAPPPSRPAVATPPPPTAPPPAAPAVDREAEARREAARKRAILEEMVFFDFDQSTIRSDAKRVLDAKLPVLRGETAIRLRIEGHADERGSTEYNLALGSRRAGAIRDYLVGFGLAADRFEIVSYGEGRPLVEGHNEAAWSRNRRGEFVIRAGLADQ